MDSSRSSRNKAIALCDPYAWEDPRYMFRSLWLGRQHDRSRGVCASEIVNHVVVVYVFAIVLGLVIGTVTKVSNLPLIFGLVATVCLIPSFMRLQKVEAFRMQFVGSEFVHKDSEDPDMILAQVKKGGSVRHEGFATGAERQRRGTNASGSAQKEGFTQPQPVPDFNDIGVVGAPPNPFNNILVNEITYAPTRAEAPDITSPQAKIALDDFFRVQWYSDPTDVFGKSQSQREFVTAPVTTIPNDQGSYQDWLYRIPGKTCKEGNAKACWGGTDGGVVPWLNL
jgi:hypothetical protein